MQPLAWALPRAGGNWIFNPNMSEHFATEVEIGGPVPQMLLNGLVQAIIDSGLGVDWEYSSEADIHSKITSCSGSQTLTLTACEFAGGGAAEPENFCIRHRIPYTKRLHGKHEYNGELTWWRPGMRIARIWEDTDITGEPVMLRREALEEALSAGETLQQVFTKLQAVAAPLPPIQIIPA
jgi:hypothetical protein